MLNIFTHAVVVIVVPENTPALDFHASLLTVQVARAPLPRGQLTKPMPRVLHLLRFLTIAVAGWMNQRQLRMIDYMRGENDGGNGKRGHSARENWAIAVVTR
jgi:hypothetical protein